jgi:WD40 repeat protein
MINRRTAMLLPSALAILAMFAALLSGCAASSSLPTSTPQKETPFVPTPTLTLAPSPTPAVTPVAVESWTATAESVPASGQLITAGNINRLTVVAQLGDGWPSSAAYSPDGATLAIGSSLGINLYEAAGGRLRKTIPSDSPVLSVQYSPDGKRLAAGREDGRILVLDPAGGAILRPLISHTRAVHGLAFSRSLKPGGPSQMLASGDEKGNIVVWDLATGQARYQFSNPLFGYWGYGVRSLAFSPQNRILATGGDQGYVALWNMATGKELPHLQSQHGLVFGVAFSPDGNTLASACGDGSVQLWDFASGAPILNLAGQQYGAWSVAYTPDGKTIATGAGDGIVRLWDPRTGALRTQATVSYAQIDSIAFSADGSQLAAVSIGESARVIRTADMGMEYILRGSFGAIRSAAFSPDSGHVILAGENGGLISWDLQKGSLVGESATKPSGNAGVAVIYAPDGKTVALADGSRNSLSLLDPDSLLVRSAVPIRGGRAAAYDPGGAYLAAGGMELVVMESGSGKFQRLTLPAALTSIAFPQNPQTGKSLLAASTESGSVLLWDLSTGESRELFTEEGGSIWSVAAYGPLLAAGDGRGWIRMWDPNRDVELWTKNGSSTEAVFSLAFSPDGKLLASAGRDAVIRIWDSTTGKFLGSMGGHNGWIYQVAFSPDGRWLLSAGKDGSARIWGVGP